MATWSIEYNYNDRADDRDQHRPAHREYLAALAEQGTMLAYGRFDDDGAPGALLVCEAPTAEDVEAILAADPFMVEGLVSSHQVRHWPATWGTGLTERIGR